jgi:hypothetical protein
MTLALLREVNRQDAEAAKFRTDLINVSGLALLAPLAVQIIRIVAHSGELSQ